MLLLLSIAYLGFALYWSFKKDVPQFLYNFFVKHHKVEDLKPDAMPAAVQLVMLIATVLNFIATWQIIKVFHDFQHVTDKILFVLFAQVIISIPVMGNIRKCFFAISRRETKKDKEAAMRKAYDAKEWATEEQIAKRLQPNDGTIYNKTGISIGGGWHWNEKGHILTVGGSGQGKGVNLILPALLSNALVRGGTSVVCLDPKGENAAVAAPHLKAAGYDVHILNPTWIKEIKHLGNSQFNPFDFIDPDSNDASRLYDLLAMSLHARKGGEGAFFDSRARQYISLYISFAHHSGNGIFDAVYSWLMCSGEKRINVLSSMAEDETFEGAEMAQAILDRLEGEAAKTEEGVYATIEDAINVLKDKNIRGILRRSDFDLKTIAKKPTAIFICVPFEDLHYYAPWVRMFFNLLLRSLTKHYDVNRKVLVLLDEFPQLEYMEEVVKSAAVLRGYNVTLWTVIQNLGQLETIYGNQWETFIGNSIIKQWLSTGTDNTTADYISHRMPQALKFIGSNADGSPKEMETKLLNANEVMGFPDMVCEISGLPIPARFKKRPYWDFAFSKDNAAPNPFYNETGADLTTSSHTTAPTKESRPDEDLTTSLGGFLPSKEPEQEPMTDPDDADQRWEEMKNRDLNTPKKSSDS